MSEQLDHKTEALKHLTQAFSEEHSGLMEAMKAMTHATLAVAETLELLAAIQAGATIEDAPHDPSEHETTVVVIAADVFCVECMECGMVDTVHSAREAEEAAQQHREGDNR